MPFQGPNDVYEFFRDPNAYLRRVTERLNALENTTVVFNGVAHPLMMSPHNGVVDLDAKGNKATAGTAGLINLTVTADNDNDELDVAWTNVSATAEQLFLERGTDGETFAPLITLAGDATEHSDDTVSQDVEYFYRIRSFESGQFSAWSNIDSGEISNACTYSAPDDMGSSTAFKQGFVGADYSDANWVTNLQDGNTSIVMSENGRMMVVTGAFGGGHTARVLTREDDNSFTCEVLHSNTGFVSDGRYRISRNGIVAGAVSGASAVWLSGVTSAPTTDSGVNRWDGISADGTKLYGVKDNGDAIERTVGGADVVIASNCWSIFAVESHCCECVIVASNGVDDFLVYRKVAGTWTHTATLGNTAGSTNNASAVVGMNGSATRAFGSNAASTVPYVWDITGTGTINATAMGVPADDTGARCLVTDVASGGNLVVGEYEPNTAVGAALYWLASENYATAHNLDLYLTSAGVSGMGNAAGEYFSLDTTRCSANGTQFAFRCQKGPSGTARNLFFAAVPAPT